MTTLDAVRETFRETQLGTTFTTAEIKHLVSLKFGCKSMIMPNGY